MSGEESNSAGADRDLLCKGPSGFLLWGVPWLVFVLGFSVSPGLRTALWTTSFALMGAACLLNAARCGRVHCRCTGPFFILAACTSLAYGMGLLPLGPSGWKWIGAGTVIGALVLCCIPELFLGRYRRRKDNAA
jgi:hypothetical protein